MRIQSEVVGRELAVLDILCRLKEISNNNGLDSFCTEVPSYLLHPLDLLKQLTGVVQRACKQEEKITKISPQNLWCEWKFLLNSQLQLSTRSNDFKKFIRASALRPCPGKSHDKENPHFAGASLKSL